MIQLTGFNRKKDGQLRNQIQSAEIRMNSSDCLQCFLDFGCERVIKSMINELNFVGSQIDGIANGGGALEEDNDVIQRFDK
ncbi:MAG: hypothetical protein EZS28_007215 [Streblomastix strix]|uniref:Uncharacterized protein n=1 Tax=Streblomastix strix TaxID=222440 RepID=A0A5J4WQQ9_9EUKA|nr:MAG: hypothetical protein EZS28_007215 [Streblomastix strix]